MDELELSMFVSMIAVLIQTAIDYTFSDDVEDHMLIDMVMADDIGLSLDVQLAFSAVALHDYHLQCGLICFDDELRFWVKPRSTAWFNDFLMAVYSDDRWIENFRMPKAMVAEICYKVRRLVEKRDTTYRKAVPVEIRVCCCLFKLAHGANLLECSEKFAIGRSTVGLVIREVVCAVNVVYANLIRWPHGHKMRHVMTEFKRWSGLPSVHGAIDCTQITIKKPKLYPEDYYYYKQSAFTMVAQCVVDCRKRFRDIFVGLSGSVNDQRVLRKSSLYRNVRTRRLMHRDNGCEDRITPYLLGDKGYPCLNWLLTAYREDGHERTVLQELYNKRLRRGRSVVECAFGMMKQSWREMLVKTDMHVTIVPDMFVCCCILHNLLIQKEDEVDVDELIRCMQVDFENDLRLQEQEIRRRAYEDQQDNAARVEGEISGEEQRMLVENYLGAQPRRTRV